MTNFWPSGLDLEDTSSPFEILQLAQREWAEQSDRLLTLVIQEAESNNNDMLIVHARHVPSNRTVTLFTVIHRPGAPYPATIAPRDELPNIFKKSYYQPGFAAVMGSATGGQVTNKWVCDTPSEFRAKLRDVFNLGRLKSEVVSLVSGDASSTEIDSETETLDEGASDGESDDVDS